MSHTYLSTVLLTLLYASCSLYPDSHYVSVSALPSKGAERLWIYILMLAKGWT